MQTQIPWNKGLKTGITPGNFKDLSGQKFGQWTILSRDVDRTDKVYWICRCECGNEVSVRSIHLINGSSTKCKHSVFGKNNPLYIGYEDISGTYFSRIKNGAKNRDIEFDISIEYIWNLFMKQDKKCALTGWILNMGSGNYKKQNSDPRDKNHTASLDRIDSNKGYVEGNVQWVHKDINIAKNEHSLEYFISICEAVIKKNKNI